MSMPIPLQFLTVVPGFLIEQGNVQSYCDENLNEIVTATATLQGRNVKNIIQQRAMCHNWVKNVIKLIEVADTETIMVLFNKTQRAL
jgi:hypothetical protein